MDAQWTAQFSIGGPGSTSHSLHYTFPPISVIAQLSLAARYDEAGEAPAEPEPEAITLGLGYVPPPRSTGAHVWWEYMRHDGKPFQESVAPSTTPVFAANDLVEATGLLFARHCWASALVNLFVWPEVSPDHLHSGPPTDRETRIDASRAHPPRTIALHSTDPGGKIRHQHTVLTMEGGREVSQDEAVETARSHAFALGHPVAELGHAVSSDPEHIRRPHRIDLETGRFVPLHG